MNQLFSLGFAALILAGTTASATVLTIVPRQGGMLMPVVFYHAETDSVTVDLSAATNIVPQLTPLLVSNPDDRFAPNYPWYDDLDPSRRGLAFSRRYGFEMHFMTDFLPDHRELWIRRISATPGISFYDYNEDLTPKTWNPFFGTAGTSNAIYWNGGMWHFGVTSPPGTNTYAATFEIFVMNTITGVEVPGSSTGPFELPWTSVPDGRPVLSITATATNNLVVTWPAPALNWFLLSAANLNAAEWITHTGPVLTNDYQCIVIVTNSNPSSFFRLQHFP